MALITCPDCGREESDAAPACSHCGRQVVLSSRVSPPSSEVRTIELMGKRVKLHSLLSALSIIVGLVWMIVNTASGQPSSAGTIGSIGFMLGGLIRFVAARISSWWHHK